MGRVTLCQLQLISQTWLTPADVDRREWQHWVSILQPDRADTTSAAVLFINGGSASATPPSWDPLFAPAAELSGMQIEDPYEYRERLMLPK